MPAPLILHVPYTYFPDPAGGTEVYVEGLARQLGGLGYPSAIAAPGSKRERYEHNGLDVCRFATSGSPRIEHAYGAPDEVAAAGFAEIVAELRPAIVHLHARTAAVSVRLVEIAHAAGARAVLTYHTPTVSCARGTMMLYGASPCDGEIQRLRCTSCALAARGVPRTLGTLAALIPNRVGARLGPLGDRARPARALQIPSLIAGAHAQFRSLMAKADHIVAVCAWVENVLIRNGVPADRITLSRQGIGGFETPQSAAGSRPAGGPLRLAYFGRVDPAKGPDLLVAALARIPDAQVSLDIFAIRQAGADAGYDRLTAMAARDRRVRVRPAVAADEVRAVMAGYDLIAIPSRWLETGPLVALEAFAAGVPVLGSDLGGIAELVRDGIDGVLVAPDNVQAWADKMLDLAMRRWKVDDLRTGVRWPRSIAAAAEDMAGVYRQLLDAAVTPFPAAAAI